MHPSLRRMLSAVRTCKKSVWRCLKRVRRIPLLRSCFKHKTNEMNATVHDEDLSSTVESQEATVTESSTPTTMKVQYKKILKETVECENSSTSSTLADDDRISATKCEITPKNGKKARKEKSRAKKLKEPPAGSAVVGDASPKKKDNISDANESRCTTETPTVSVSRASRTKGDLLKVESNNSRATKTPLNSAPSPASNNASKSFKDPVIEPVIERSKEQLSKGSINVERTHKTCTNQQRDDVLCVKADNRRGEETIKHEISFPSAFGSKNDYKNRPINSLNEFSNRAVTNSSGVFTQYNNTFGIKHDNNTFTAARPRMIPTKFQNDIELHKSENPWVPKVVAREAVKNTIDGIKLKTKPKGNKTQELKTTVNSMLYTLKQLTESFAVLPIDTVEELENTVDLVFEKAIRERNCTSLYASLCSVMQSIQVRSDDDKNTQVSFKTLILRKCQSQFQEDKVRRTKSVNELKEINSCEDPVKKKGLRFAFQENERRSRERSVRNCRFIGELFNQNMVKPSIMTYCMATLIREISDEPLECLCDLLKTAGRQLEICCDIKTIFDKLGSLASDKNVSSRTKCTIQDVINLRKNKWSP